MLVARRHVDDCHPNEAHEVHQRIFRDAFIVTVGAVAAVAFLDASRRSDTVRRDAFGPDLRHVGGTCRHHRQYRRFRVHGNGNAFKRLEHLIVDFRRRRDRPVDALGDDLHARIVNHCRQLGIEVLTPSEEEQDAVDRIIFDELTKGVFRDESRSRLLEIIGRYSVDGVILGCTELPLILKQEDAPVALLDTLELHARAALDHALEE